MSKDKVQKEYPDFCDEVNSLPPEALRSRVVALQQALSESEEHKEANQALTNARSAVLELAAPYRDVKKAVKLKTSYLLALLEEKGS